MGLELIFPCSENSDEMPNTSTGKYCSQCDKNIVDFTNWEKEDIMQYVSSKRTCGIFRNEQLDKINALTVVHIRPKLDWISKIAASLAVFTLVFSSCIDKQNQATNNGASHKEHEKEGRQKTLGILIPPKIISIDSGGELLGMMISVPGPDSNGVYCVVPQMPEFIGGEDSMLNYLSSNIDYPKYESDNNIEGTVYAQFVVDENGKVNNVEILKSVAGSKNLNKEVIRVLENMPKWKPGRIEGEPVKVYYVIPIEFEN